MSQDKGFVLRIGNLNYRTTASALEEHCKTYGESNVVLLMNRDGLSKGIATVTYKTEKEAREAYQGLNQKNFEGRILSVIASDYIMSPPEPKRAPRPPSPGLHRPPSRGDDIRSSWHGPEREPVRPVEDKVKRDFRFSDSQEMERREEIGRRIDSQRFYRDRPPLPSRLYGRRDDWPPLRRSDSDGRIYRPVIYRRDELKRY